MKDTIILFSGGLDSTVLLYSERDRIKAALFASYAQPSEREEGLAATIMLDALHIPMKHVYTPMSGIEDMQAQGGVRGPRIVPARNLILLAHAVNLALAEGCSRVIYGATGGDVGAYADCRASFVTALSSACRGLGCVIEAPLLGKSKAAVVALGRSAGAPLELSWSCYAPRHGQPCGGCNACLERGEALVAGPSDLVLVDAEGSRHLVRVTRHGIGTTYLDDFKRIERRVDGIHLVWDGHRKTVRIVGIFGA